MAPDDMPIDREEYENRARIMQAFSHSNSCPYWAVHLNPQPFILLYHQLRRDPDVPGTQAKRFVDYDKNGQYVGPIEEPLPEDMRPQSKARGGISGRR